MLFRLAWRNIWRNKRRSIIVLSSVVVGVAASMTLDAFQNGMISQMLRNQISLNVSHLQVHSKGFKEEKTLNNFIAEPDEVADILKEESEVVDFSKRVIAFGLISSADNSSGVYIYGVEPEHEQNVSSVKESIIRGGYLTGAEREIIIGELLAKKLSVDVGDKVVAMSNTPDGSIGSEAYRIVGVFRSPSSEFDKSYIFIPLFTAQRMLEIGNGVHEFAMITKDYHNAERLKEALIKKLGDKYEVHSYIDNLPMLVLTLEMYKEMVYIVNLIIGLALIFGIINSMLMSVYERIQEIGVLMSIGMKNIKIVLMILFEALIIGVLGTFIGVIFGYVFHALFLQGGINLSVFAESLQSFGIGAIIYPVLSLENLISLLIMIPFIAVLGAFYPAYKAVKLEPVYAIRYV